MAEKVYSPQPIDVLGKIDRESGSADPLKELFAQTADFSANMTPVGRVLLVY